VGNVCGAGGGWGVGGASPRPSALLGMPGTGIILPDILHIHDLFLLLIVFARDCTRFEHPNQTTCHLCDFNDIAFGHVYTVLSINDTFDLKNLEYIYKT
jgi:hypothetical protein